MLVCCRRTEDQSKEFESSKALFWTTVVSDEIQEDPRQIYFSFFLCGSVTSDEGWSESIVEGE